MKTKVFAILAVIIVLGTSQLVKANLVDSNSIIKDGIEYYMQTDKFIYDLGENVEMLYKVTNLSDEDVTFAFSQKPVYNFWVEKDGEHIWRAINWWLMVSTEFTLSPGEFREFPDDFEPPYIWNMRDDESNLVSAGQYDVIGGLYNASGYYDYTKVAVPIEIIPEPTTILLLGLGMLGVRAC